MKISGLQKLTLLDYPGKVACTVFTKGCNFRCPYCHNASLVLMHGKESAGKEEFIEERDFFDFLEKRKKVLDGVVVTGGEPTINEDLPEFMEKIKRAGFKVKLDTNGAFPQRLKELILNGLVDYVAMDIKSSPDMYAKTVGVNHLDFTAVDESRKFLMEKNVDYEFRTTVVRGIHRPRDILKAAKWIEGAEAYYLQQFKDSGDLIDNRSLHAYSEEDMYMLADIVRPHIHTVEVRGI